MTVTQSQLLARLLEVTRALSTMVDLETYLRTILSAAAELTESETASLMEYDEVTRELYFKYVPWFHRDAISSARIPLNESAAGWVFLNVKPLIINDVKNDTRHYSKIDELAGFSTRSLLSVPLLLYGRPVGVFEVFNRQSNSYYTEEDIAIIEALAALATTAMQNDMLESNLISYQNETRELIIRNKWMLLSVMPPD